MEEKITLDRDSFRALASDTRVSILKSLDRRRKTLTELSKEMGMSPSTVKEHMENLCNSGLTVLVDDGHKWKYYELTRKGTNILHPQETRIWILLSISALAMVGIFYDMAKDALLGTASYAARAPEMVAAPAQGAAKEAANALADAAASAAPALPIYHIAGLLLFAVVLGACVSYLALSRKKMIFRA